MSIFEGIKAKAGERYLKKELRERKGKVMNFKDATSVGFLYKIKDEEQYKIIRKFIKHLKEEEGISNVLALGYLDQKDVPRFVQHRLEFDYFTKKDVNWHHKPGGTEVQNFMTEPWDILIDLSFEKVVPLRYILAQCKSRFRIGVYSPKNEPFYDMMIKMEGTPDLKTYLEQVNYYLTIINRSDVKA